MLENKKKEKPFKLYKYKFEGYSWREFAPYWKIDKDLPDEDLLKSCQEYLTNVYNEEDDEKSKIVANQIRSFIWQLFMREKMISQNRTKTFVLLKALRRQNDDYFLIDCTRRLLDLLEI